MSKPIVQVLANPALRRVQLAFFGSTLGDWAYSTAIVVWAYTAGGATAVGVYLALRFLVGAVAGPIGATVADRVSRKHYMMSVDAIRAALVGAAAVTIGVGGPDLAVYVATLAAVGVGASFRSAQAGLVPRLVDGPAELTAANAVSSNLETVSMFAGPALGALLVATFDVQLVLWLNAATFVWSLALVAAVRVPPAADADTDADEDEPEEGDGFVREVTVGFVELGRNRDLGAVATLAAAQGMLWGALTVFLVIVAVDELGTGPSGVGYLNSVMGVGTVVGGLLLLTRVGRGRLARDMAYGVLGWALPIIAMALFPSPVTAVAALASIGLSDPWVNLGLDTIPQRLAPEQVLSRVFSAVESALIASMALGSVVAPVLVHLVGVRPAMGLLGGLVTALVVVLLPRLRRLDDRLSEPEHVELLRSLDLFAPLPAPTVESLARSLEPTRFAAGDRILTEGESADRFYVIASGAVDVTREGERLRTERTGDYFGEIALLRDVPRTASVTAATDVLLLGLARADFLQAVAGVRESARAAEDVVARRLGV
ncbi:MULTISPECIES: MFS transporter [unclassified Nocardioides]|uniref:MFS transporter n=1 Tax=unclassified Nocardioides TaxID=2615069 RepID=UPI0006FB75D3|nr:MULTISPECIES: MFS transporter [unclassified Nocardioides]